MLEGLCLVELVFVRLGFPAASLTVETHADVVFLHEGLGDTVDIQFTLLLRIAGSVPRATGLLARALLGETFLEGVWLWFVDKPDLDDFEAFLDD